MFFAANERFDVVETSCVQLWSFTGLLLRWWYTLWLLQLLLHRIVCIN